MSSIDSRASGMDPLMRLDWYALSGFATGEYFPHCYRWLAR